MKNKFLLILILGMLFSCSKKNNNPTVQTSLPTEKIILVKTTFGNIYIWLYKETPLHRNNFLALADTNYFDGTTFHRIVPNFVIQGGDPNSKDTIITNDGDGGPKYTIPAEIDSSKFKHTYGAVGAARDNNPAKASNGSQFYIVIPKAGASFLDGNYTVFGTVISGMDIAEKIVKQPRDANDRPKTNITMDIDIIEKTLDELKTDFNFSPK